MLASLEVRGPTRWPWLPLLLLALLVAACGAGHAAPRASAGPPHHSPEGAPVARAVGADTLLPLPDGPLAFAALRSLLGRATRSIHLEVYEFQRTDLADQVIRAHDRGVEVIAVMDPSERGSRSVWARLQQAGARVVAFPVDAQSIDHVKLLIVDGQTAVVGGINWGRHSEANRDYDVLVSGPAVANLERVFAQDLALSGQVAVIPPATQDPLVQVLVTRPGDAIRSAVLTAVAEAQRRIDVEMFVLSDPLVLDALAAAARRGVQVRVLLDAGQPQNRDALAVLLRSGARAHLYPAAAGQKLHAKLGIFDGALVLFGSCNWSRSGFARNHELDLLIADPGLASVFLDRLEQDFRVA